MQADLAPIALFAYKRLDTLEQTINALKVNNLASLSPLYVFSDGYKGEKDEKQVRQVRKYLKTVTGFASVQVIESEQNKGLARSIIAGVSKVLELHNTVIVLEDDLVTSANFLTYMNSALDFYQKDSRIYSVSGFTLPLSKPAEYAYDNYFHKRACSWGWATWKDRWVNIDWKLLQAATMNDLNKTREMGSDFPSLVKKYRLSVIDSWAVPWCYYSFKHSYYTVYPTRSKVQNVGFDLNATHTSQDATRYATQLDSGTQDSFKFGENAHAQPYFNKQYLRKFSLFERLRWRVIKDVKRLIGT